MRLRALFAALAVGALLAAPASATFLGLENGDVIETLGFNIAPGDGVFDEPSGSLTINAKAQDITTTVGSPGGPEVLTEILGGDAIVDLVLDTESVVPLGGTFFFYSATFDGATGNDVELFAPTGGPAPEQDGRLLIAGELTGQVTIETIIDTADPAATEFIFGGEFSVLASGDATFKQAFGTTGDLADILGTTTSTDPLIDVLLADLLLFNSSFTFDGNGEVQPQNPSPFVPEPGAAVLVVAGVGLALVGRARRHGLS
jgi:hypothetical protein